MKLQDEQEQSKILFPLFANFLPFLFCYLSLDSSFCRTNHTLRKSPGGYNFIINCSCYMVLLTTVDTHLPGTTVSLLWGQNPTKPKQLFGSIIILFLIYGFQIIYHFLQLYNFYPPCEISYFGFEKFYCFLKATWYSTRPIIISRELL